MQVIGPTHVHTPCREGPRQAPKFHPTLNNPTTLFLPSQCNAMHSALQAPPPSPQGKAPQASNSQWLHSLVLPTLSCQHSTKWCEQHGCLLSKYPHIHIPLSAVGAHPILSAPMFQNHLPAQLWPPSLCFLFPFSCRYPHHFWASALP
jgi:hypothetical protein